MVDKLMNDMVTAMKDKDKDRLAVIRAVKAGMDKERIDNKREVNDDLLIEVVNREIKMRKESIVEFEKGNREDLVNQYKSEIDVLSEYLPEQLSKEEVIAEIDKIFEKVNPTSMKDMGLIMKEASAIFKGKADMGEVSSIIKERLQNL